MLWEVTAQQGRQRFVGGGDLGSGVLTGAATEAPEWRPMKEKGSTGLGATQGSQREARDDRKLIGATAIRR